VAGRGTDMVYVDTSVLVPLFLNEPYSAAVGNWYSREKGELVAAAWCVPEFASALGIKQRTGAIDAQQAHGAWNVWWLPTFDCFRSSPPTSIVRQNWYSMRRARCAPATPCTWPVPRLPARNTWQLWTTS
jgi:predicted nucleic acid-binding protein